MRLRDMKDLGPKPEEWPPKAGIHNPEQLRASDPYEIYAKLKASVPGLNLNALYALISAIEDRYWLEVKAQDRTEILLCLDQFVEWQVTLDKMSARRKPVILSYFSRSILCAFK